jgi:hypothetical protein
MKKKKAQPEEEREEEEEPEAYKPWMLQNISPQVRKMAKECAAKHNVKLAQWVTHAIITTYENEHGQTVHMETFAELMDEYPDKEFIKNWFLGLRGKIEDLSEKLDELYKPEANRKRWWKFWR